MLDINDNQPSKKEDINQPPIIEEKLSENQPIPTSLDTNPINNLEDYTEIIPQKIDNQQKTKSFTNENDNGNLEENMDNQNLEFSFGKELQKEKIINNKNSFNKDNKDNNNSEKTETTTNANSLKNKINTMKHDLMDKRDIFSENLSSYQYTDSLSNLRDNNIEDNKKLQLIKEKFVSNFKNKERAASLEKTLSLFEKYQNYRKYHLNHSFSTFRDIPIPFRCLTTQNANNLSIIDNKDNNKKITQQTSSFSNLEIDYINKKNENIINIGNNIKNEKNMNTINIIKDINNINNKKLILKKKINRKKGLDKTLSSLKEDKKKGFYIRKVIREEKYFIGDDGKEKIIGINQSTIDSLETNEKNEKNEKSEKIDSTFKEIMQNAKDKDKDKDNYKNSNIPLLDNKKIGELIKEKISNKNIDNNYINIEDENKTNFFKNKNIEIKTELINNNNKTILNENFNNNIKIVINKINKINSNPKINLNFIKKNKTKKAKEQKCLTRNKLIENDNNFIYKTETNDNKTFHLIKVDKVDKLKNDKYIKYKPLFTNININSYLNKIKPKIKDKLKILKCEKVHKVQNKIIDKKLINIPNNFNFPSNSIMMIQKRQNSNKRNYSYKEITNLSNDSISSISSRLNKDLGNDIFKIKNKFLTIDSYSYLGNNKKKINSPKKINNNIAFYESKSFSSKKNTEQKFKIKPETNAKKDKFQKHIKNSNIQLETINKYNRTINTNKNLYQYGSNNIFDIHKNIKNKTNLLNRNIFNINNSYKTSNYSCNNNKEKNKFQIHILKKNI